MPLSRRDLLKTTGITLSLASLAGCSKQQLDTPTPHSINSTNDDTTSATRIQRAWTQQALLYHDGTYNAIATAPDKTLLCLYMSPLPDNSTLTLTNSDTDTTYNPTTTPFSISTTRVSPELLQHAPPTDSSTLVFFELSTTDSFSEPFLVADMPDATETWSLPERVYANLNYPASLALTTDYSDELTPDTTYTFETTIENTGGSDTVMYSRFGIKTEAPPSLTTTTIDSGETITETLTYTTPSDPNEPLTVVYDNGHTYHTQTIPYTTTTETESDPEAGTDSSTT